MKAPALKGIRVSLRSIEANGVTAEYRAWLCDPDVNQYLESRFQSHSLESLRTFVDGMSRSPDHLMLAILDHERDQHVGNIKLGPIHWSHGIGDIGILIGDKASWGKGFATEAIRLLTNYAFGTLNLAKVTASCYGTNRGSLKAFLNAGFVQEGVRRAHYVCQGERVDGILLAAFQSGWRRDRGARGND